MHVSIFGTGYVGLVTGTCLAEIGHDVTCIDIDIDRIAALNRGEVPIFEPGLSEMITTNVAGGRLHFSTVAADAIESTGVVFIAVGTPPAEDGSADLQHVDSVAAQIGRSLTIASVIVIKSTVPVGTADRVRAIISKELRLRDVVVEFDVVSNPEFLKEGDAVNDCMRPDRIVIGSDSPAAIDSLKRLYAPFTRQNERFVIMDSRSAELTKYAANAMLATKISFMNEMANIAEGIGADIESVRRGIGSDPRIGWHFIYPGAGYGGSCFPKDVRALERMAADADCPASLLRAVDAVNVRQKSHLFDLITRHYGQASTLVGKKFALWGLSFKPNTDDLREAPSLTLIRLLLDAGATVLAFDPEAMAEAGQLLKNESQFELAVSAQAALVGADALIVVTEWKEFQSPKWQEIAERLVDRVVFDGRNIYSPTDVESHGLAYYGIGRGRSIRRMN